MAVQVQACVDESYSENSGIYVLGGAIATAAQWAAFSREWEELLIFSKIQRSGKRAFKMTEMRNSEYLPAYYDVIRRHVACTFGFAFSMKAFDRIIKAYSTVPFLSIEWGKTANHYIFAFSVMMTVISTQKMQIDKQIGLSERIDFIFDDQSEKREILLGWDLFVENQGEEFRRNFGATPRFDDDEDFLPLQAADFEAGYVRNIIERGIKLISHKEDNCQHLRMSMNVSQIKKVIDQMIRNDLQEIFEKITS